MLIAITGYARSGKDLVAARLADHGYQRIAFADPLKQILYDLDPQLTVYSSVRSNVDRHGWEDAKTRDGCRELLQRLGVACRTHLHPDVWVDAVMRHVDAHPTVDFAIPDARFPNEVDAVRARGGQIWRVARPGVLPVNRHESETAVDHYDFDLRLLNDGTVSDLRRRVDDAITTLAGQAA